MPGASSSALPPRGGIGLKPAHFAELLDSSGRGAGPHWVEVHPQNYMMEGGPMHRWLTAIAERLPLSFHSVGLSIGDPDGPDAGELERLATLVERYRPAMVSDHLSWSSLSGTRIPDLLPVPMTRELLDHFAAGVGRIQDRLGRRILIENPSRMLAFANDEYEETDFLAELCGKSGCGLLLDVNNVIVSAANLGFDEQDWIDSIDPGLVGEIHVAGHSIVEQEPGIRLRIDDHGSPVGESCWSLLEHFIKRSGPRPVLVERDNNLPGFDELAAEAERADVLVATEMADAA